MKKTAFIISLLIAITVNSQGKKNSFQKKQIEISTGYTSYRQVRKGLSLHVNYQYNLSNIFGLQAGLHSTNSGLINQKEAVVAYEHYSATYVTLGMVVGYDVSKNHHFYLSGFGGLGYSGEVEQIKGSDTTKRFYTEYFGSFYGGKISYLYRIWDRQSFGIYYTLMNHEMQELGVSLLFDL